MEEIAQLHRQTMHHFNERQKRIYAGSVAKSYGYGGRTKVAQEVGMDVHTIARGIKELAEEPLLGRVRKPGGGRKKLVTLHPELAEVVQTIVRERGNPMKHLLYTHSSRDTLTELVRKKGYDLGKNVVKRMLWSVGFSLKGNKKAFHTKSHTDRDKQFRYIDRLVDGFLKSFNIVMSIDAKKTEKVVQPH